MTTSTTRADIKFLRKIEARVLGTRIHGLSRAQTVAWIDALLSTDSNAHIATVNPELIMRARRDRQFHRILENTHLNVADGIGVVVAARLHRRIMPERVTGIDLVNDLASLAARRAYKLMLVGGAPGVADEAGAVLQRSHPGLLPPTTHIGTPAASGDSEARDALKRCDAHLVLVAYGAPAQEQWIERNLTGFSSIVGIGVGGALDYISGRIARAPNPIRKAGLEWLFRLSREPWRWRRMRVLPVFACLAILEAIRKRDGQE